MYLTIKESINGWGGMDDDKENTLIQGVFLAQGSFEVIVIFYYFTIFKKNKICNIYNLYYKYKIQGGYISGYVGNKF